MFEYDDNITLPCIRLVFEKHNIPLISTHDEPTIFLFENNIGHAQSQEDIFHTSNPTTPTYYSFGSIINSNTHQDAPIHTAPTIHVCNHHIPYQSTNQYDFINHISTILNKNNSKGLYHLQINTNIQNDWGASDSVTNLKSILHDYHDITPYPIGGISTNGPAIHYTGFEYLHWTSPTHQINLVP